MYIKKEPRFILNIKLYYSEKQSGGEIHYKDICTFQIIYYIFSKPDGFKFRNKKRPFENKTWMMLCGPVYGTKINELRRRVNKRNFRKNWVSHQSLYSYIK